MVSFLYQSNSALLQLGQGLFMTKTNLKTLAYTAIRHKIITCEYAPGTFLNEERLTEELRLSRTPVRDALSRLEQEELIEIRPKRGIMVTPLVYRKNIRAYFLFRFFRYSVLQRLSVELHKLLIALCRQLLFLEFLVLVHAGHQHLTSVLPGRLGLGHDFAQSLSAHALFNQLIVMKIINLSLLPVI